MNRCGKATGWKRLLLVLAIASAMSVLVAPLLATARDVTITDAILAEEILLAFKSKHGEYRGDTVQLTVTNNANQDIQLTIPKGTVLANRNTTRQNLVVSRATGSGVTPIKAGTKIVAYVIAVKAGEQYVLSGLWTFCIDNERGGPSTGDRFDVGPSIGEWPHPAAANLARLLDEIDARNLHGESDAQSAVWFYTDGNASTSQVVRGLITASGGDPAAPPQEFPHLKNPITSGSAGTAVVALGEVTGGSLPQPSEISLTAGEVKERTITFERSPQTFTYLLHISQATGLHVQLQDLGVPGDTWSVEIYEAGLLKRVLTSDQFGQYSEEVVIQLETSEPQARVLYVKGTGNWPAAMRVRFSIPE